MAQRHAPPAQQVQVAERVTFRDEPRTVAGHVVKKEHTYVHVVTDAGTEVRVPYRLLARDAGTPRQPVQSQTDLLRAQWQAGDRVAFARATLSRARRRAGSRRPSGGSGGPCVAPVMAQYGIRRTPSTAGSRIW
jgi:hypothetical protein